MRLAALLFAISASFALLGSAAQAQAPVAKPFDPPSVTEWVPDGCRQVPPTDPVLASRIAYRRLHSDMLNSDEMSRVSPPVFEEQWTADPHQFNGVGPAFDSAGNPYYAPFRPYDDTKLVSVDRFTGERRWAIEIDTPAPPGAGTPLVLSDPDNPGQEIVYSALYDRILAVRTDGTPVYDAPTGLVAQNVLGEPILGTGYVPSVDAIVGVAVNGSLFAHDRATGESILNAIYQLPGEPTPPGTGAALPPPVLAAAEQIFRQFVMLPPNQTFNGFIDALLGNGVEVANDFGMDPRTSHLWVGATAPDAEDGTVDGFSEFGAVYQLEFVPSGDKYDIQEVCHISFAGGTASTPTLNQDGTRLYVGDNDGNFLAVNPVDCEVIWSLNVGSQIVASMAVSSDNAEIYVPTITSIVQLFERGDHGELGWVGNLDAFEFPVNPLPHPLLGNLPLLNFNLLNPGISANGITVHIGAGPIVGFPLPLRLGSGVLDRDTGELRYFAEGSEESIAAMNLGADGAWYSGNAPFRRIIARVLFPPLTDPIMGGLTKYGPTRNDLVVRDVACASEARAANAFANRDICPASSAADVTQLRELIGQAREAGALAIAAGDLTVQQWLGFERDFEKADNKLDPKKLQHLNPATQAFRRICSAFE